MGGKKKSSWKFGVFLCERSKPLGLVEVDATLQTWCGRKTATLKERQEMLFSGMFSFQE